MLILDITVVNVALPDMEHTLHAQLTDLEWVVDAYALALGSLLLVAGSVGDRIGRRVVFLFGMALFTAGSLWSSLASSPVTLILGRGVQGIGGACLFASALAVIGHEFRGRQRGRALGVWGAAIGAGLAVGPLVGGLLTDAFGWPAIFLVNVPLGTGMFVATLLRMPESCAEQRRAVDVPGAALVIIVLFCFVFGLVEGNRLGWSSPLIVGALAVSVALAVVFFRIERRDDSLFDARLLGDRDFLAASVAVIGQGVVIAAITLYLPRDLQEVGDASPLVAGLEILPMTVVAFTAAVAGGRLASRHAPAPVLAGALVLLALGSALLIFFNPAAGSWVALVPGLVATGVGWGATNPVAAHAALEAADEQRTGMASGFNNTARQIGIAAGIGGLGAAFQARVATATAARLHDVASPALSQRLGQAVAQSGRQGAAGAPPGIRSQLAKAAPAAMTSGLHLVELLGALAALVMAMAVAVIGRRRSAR